MSKERRSALMAKVRSKNTGPEMIVRKELFKRGYRYRLHVKALPGTPDIVLAKYRCAIFVNGCFWHGHQDCKKAKLPQTHKEFWQKKIETNKAHDVENGQKLIVLGWNVVTIWECELKGDQSVVDKIIDQYLM